MFFLPYFRRCGTGMLFALLFPLFSFAQLPDNHIEITLLEESYDCATGEVSISFHITNIDQDGNYGMYNTAYTINTGSGGRSRSLPQGDNDVFYTGPYVPGHEITITAFGLSNNAAPETGFVWVPAVGSLPEKPIIWSTSTMPLCNGTSVVMHVTSSVNNYIWSDGSTGITLVTSTPGVYTVRAIGECGTSEESDPFVVTIGSTPNAPVIGSSAGNLLCNGASTTLSATSSGGTVNWSNGNVGTSFSTSAPGTYYASETNGCGTSGNSNVIVISTGNTPPAPFVSSSNGVSLCNGASTTLSTWSSAGGSISWNTGATGNSINVSSPGDYYAYETNGCGTSAISNIVSITSGGTPAPPVINSSNGALLCNGVSTTLTASGSGSIAWNTGATGNSISISTAGTYYATASNNCGTSAASNTITISTGVTPGSPSVSSSGGILLCNSTSTTLSTSPSYGGTIYWNTGATGNSIAVNSGGSYYAYEVNACATGSNSNTVNITTSSTPAAPSVTPSGDQLLCNGASITLSSSGSNVAWNTGATGNTITVSTAGSFYSYDRNACGNSANSNVVNTVTVVCPTPLPDSSFFVCPGALKLLDAGAGYDTYQWSNGANTRTISVGPGTYTVTVSKQGCFATSAAVTVGYYTVTTPTVSASGATTFCAGGSVVLTASSGNAYSWSNGATTNPITASTASAYYVTVTDGNGCQATSSAINVTVNALPTATISGGGTVCQGGSSTAVVFSGSGGAAPYTFQYRVNGGSIQTVNSSSGNSVSISVPASTAGDFVYSLVGVSESSATNCSNAASGSVTVSVRALPSASIAGNATVCRGAASPVITFSANGGNAPYTFTYRINGSANQTVVASSGNSATVSVPTTTAGTYNYSLVSVQEGSGNACVNGASGSATVVVNPLPDASISGTATVCQGATSPVISFAGSGGVAPYTFSYRINGGAVQSISTVSGNSVTLAVPTTAPGIYTYALVSVRESSGTACTNAASGSVAVTVNVLPSATITGSTTVCKNSASPVITFTANGGAAPYTFAYRINGGLLQTITTTTGNSATVLVPTSAEGSFAYTLVSVQESSSTSCSNTATGSATVVINPLPTATISGSTNICQNSTRPLITFSGNGGTAPYTFSYRIGSGSVQTVTTVSGNNVTIEVPTENSGTFTYSIVSVLDASSTSCSNGVNGSATIVINPQPVKAITSAVNTHLCNGETGVIKINNYQNGLSYTWYKDGQFLRTNTTDTLKVTVAGSYTVLVTNSQGCTAGSVSDAVIITTGSVVTPVITGSVKVCVDGKTMLTVLGTDGSEYERWRWTGPPDKGKILSEANNFFAEAGQYRVKVFSAGCIDSTNVTVTADDTEFPAGELKIDKSSIDYGETIRLYADVSRAVNYRWDLGNGRTVQTRSNTIHESYFIPGDSVAVKVWATSARNCKTLFTTFVKVSPMKVDTLADHSFTGRVKDWNVFPIPFRDRLQFTAILLRNENVRVDAFVPDGKWVRSWMLAGRKGENVFTLDGAQEFTPNVLYFLVSVYNGEKHYEKIYKY